MRPKFKLSRQTANGLEVALVFLVCGLIYITFTDGILLAILPDAYLSSTVETVKDFGFIALTTLLVFLLVRDKFAIQARAERARRAEEEKFKLLVETVAEGIVIFDDKGLITFANDSAEKLLGLGRDEILERSYNGPEWEITDISGNPIADKDMPFTIAMAAGEAVHGFEMRFKVGDNRATAMVNTVPIKGPGGRPSGAVTSFSDMTERKRQESMLLESEVRYRSLVENMSSGVAVFRAVDEGEDFEFVEINRAVERIEKVSRSEVLGKRVTVAFPGVEEFGLLDVFKRAWRTGEPELHGVELYHDERISGWRESYVYKLPSGEIVSVYNDQTENVRSRQALERSELDKNILLESTSELVAYQDREHKIIWANRAAGESVGKAAEDIIGQYCYAVWQGLDRPCEGCPVESSLRTGETHEIEMPTPDGRYYLLRANPVVGPDGQVLGAVEIGLDITERRQAEEAARRSEEDLAITLACIGDGVIAADSRGLVTRLNPVAARLTGWSLDEAPGRPVAEVLRLADADSNEPLPDPAKEVLEGAESVTMNSGTVLLGKQENRMRVSLDASPICQGGGEVLGVVISFRDTSEQFRLEERLRQSQKMEAIGQLAGGIAHDFNNLLSGIMGYAELLKLQAAESGADPAMADTIIETAKRAAELTSQLLAFSRRGRLLSVSFDAHEVIGKVEALLERTIDKRVSIATRLEAQAAMVKGDPGQVQNAVINLAVNSRDALPEGGDILISTQNVVIGGGYAHPMEDQLEPGAYIVIVVADNGAGMDPETLSHVFEPFFTTKGMSKGTGLGLASVYGTVKSHGGGIHIESEPGVGTECRVYLPLTEEQKALVLADETELVRGEGTALLVDDEEVIRQVGRRMLEYLGYKVITAENGPESIEVYKERSGEIDIVIMDMIMPRIGGAAAIRGIREIDPGARVIVSTGFSLESSTEELQELGVSDIIQKPFAAAELSRKLARALGGPDPDGPTGT